MLTQITRHCQKRQRQRGRNDTDISILMRYGEHHRGGRLLTRRQVKKHAPRLRRWLKKHTSSCVQRRAAQMREIVRRLEKIEGWMLVVTPQGKAITIYPASKQRQHRFMQGRCRSAEDFQHE